MLLRGRLLYKLGKEAALVRRRRRKEVKTEVRELTRSFLDDADDGGQQEAVVLSSASDSMDVQGQMVLEEPDTYSEEF